MCVMYLYLSKNYIYRKIGLSTLNDLTLLWLLLVFKEAINVISYYYY